LYKKVDAEISDIALKKFLNHLWYLNAENIAFSLYDDDVAEETKEKMRKALIHSEEEEENTNEDDDESDNDESHEDSRGDAEKLFVDYERKVKVKKISDLEDMVKKGGLEQFIRSKITLQFFTRFELNKDFLRKSISDWSTDEGYNEGKNIVKKIKVVNDAAERGVKLIEDYNAKLTKDESQKQFLLQVVENYRKKFPDSRKFTLCPQ
jgi:hypothetical protein